MTRFLARLLVVTTCALLVAAVAHAKPKPAPPARLYQLALLRRAEAWTPERNAHTDSIQAGHMANIRRMFTAGDMYGAGPFGDDTALRGVFFLRTDSTGWTSPMLNDDPALASHRLRAELHRWWGPAGLSDDYQRRADRGLRDSMVTFTFVLLQRGPNWTANATPGVKRVLRAHAKHLEKLRAKGALAAVGAVEGTGALRGILIFDADTAATRRFVEKDPAVKAGRFVPEIHPWWTAYGVIPGH